MQIYRVDSYFKQKQEKQSLTLKNTMRRVNNVFLVFYLAKGVSRRDADEDGRLR